MCTGLLLILPSLVLAAAPPTEPRSRTFRFIYTATVTGLEANQPVRIWIPVPSSTTDQTVELVEQDLPGPSRLGTEPTLDNRILYIEPRANPDGVVPIKLVYRVTRWEVRMSSPAPAEEEAERFLKPDTMAPAKGKHLQLLEGKKLPADALATARALYDLVNSELRYSKKGTGWGHGDVNWVCGSKYGNCTDFHSLFIALARARDIPGKFEIGFSLSTNRGKGEVAGYHCWAKFMVKGKGWMPVDISMANQEPKWKEYCFGNLTEDRVMFSQGRDIQLVPKQDSPPLNFFIYPHVEVGGKSWPAEKTVKRFAFEDVVGK